MSDRTKIQWTDATWNPISGCTKVSPGCKHCYAERWFPRVYRAEPGRKFSDVRFHQEKILQPLHWTRPRKIFVNSMSDLFHEAVTGEQIAMVYATMAVCPQHVFQVLTKRPGLARQFLRRSRVDQIESFAAGMAQQFAARLGQWSWPGWPLPNVWLGVSVECQAVDYRVDSLLDCPAAVRFVSAEPLIGDLDLVLQYRRAKWTEKPRIDWVIVGGESGSRARPMHPDWARQIRDDCDAAGVPFFFKQWGEWEPCKRCADPKSGRRPTRHVVVPRHVEVCRQDQTTVSFEDHPRIGEFSRDEAIMRRRDPKAKGEALLDGRSHQAFPDRS